MSYDREDRGRSNGRDRRRASTHSDEVSKDRSRRRDEIYAKRVPAGKRTYFFDVKSTRSGRDFFITITESKRIDENRYEKHKLFLYKEDFGKFVHALHEVIDHIRDECLPDYDFEDLPELAAPVDDYDDAYDDDAYDEEAYEDEAYEDADDDTYDEAPSYQEDDEY